jgi:glyoxylase-like metal-dependent hydrolase (beta-lactamase superfamily II)
MYDVDVLVQGYPGKSLCHGGLGWSTIALLRGQGRAILVDVGAFGVRRELAKQLRSRDVRADTVTDVVITHAHYDHSVNFTLFPKATVWIGAGELEWAAAQSPGFDPLPELYVRELAASPRVKRIEAGQAFLPGLTALAAPGHTPGHLLFLLEGDGKRILFTGDAAKNRAELLSCDPEASDDRANARASIELIWAVWRQVPGTVLVPGHDLSMRLDADGAPEYIGERKAGIAAWFDESIELSTTIDLCRQPS